MINKIYNKVLYIDVQKIVIFVPQNYTVYDK